MNIVFKRPTIYCSHPIRGSNNDIAGNCARAKRAGERLRRVFPECDFYVPADGDLTLQILTSDKKLNVDDVMYADLQILKACHEWMWYDFDKSVGCVLEGGVASDTFWFSFEDMEQRTIHDAIEKMSYARIRTRVGPIVEQAIRNFRKVNR